MIKKNSLVFLMVWMMAFSIFILAGCTAPVDLPEDPDENQGGTVVFALWSAPKGVFNMNLYETRYDADSFWPVFDGLLGYNPDLSYYENLAETWSVSDDGQVFYYNLRDDIYFHDGVPVTTEDVKFTFEWMCHPDYTGGRSGNWSKLVGYDDFQQGNTDDLEGIKIRNDREIEFHFSEPDAPAHGLVSTWFISPKHIFEGTPVADLDKHEAITKPMGTGPFRFHQYVEGAYVELVRNDDYHLGAPRLERIIVKVANPDAAQVELITGGVTAAWVQPNARDFETYRDAGLSIKEYPANAYQYMGFWMKDGFFADKRVRQAITYAVDRFSMVESLLDGMGTVQVGHMTGVSWAYNESLKPYRFDPQKARDLLAQAGWSPGEDGVLVKDGEKFSFTLSYPSGMVAREESALVIQQNLKEVGIEVDLDMMEFQTLDQLVFEDMDFDVYLMAWGLGQDPDASLAWSSASPWSAVQHGFDHPDNDRLLIEGRTAVAQEDRKPIYDRWQELLYEEAPFVWLYSSNEAYVFDGSLKEFKPNSFGIWYDVHKWHFVK